MNMLHDNAPSRQVGAPTVQQKCTYSVQSAPIELVRALFDHLSRGGNWMFTQAIGTYRRTSWLPAGKSLAYPQDWNGQLNIYWGVNPASTPVTNDDRTRYPGKTDAQIMPLVGSKNTTISAVNAFIADLDGKDYTYPTPEEIAAAHLGVRSEMEARLSSGELSRPTPENGLLNQAFNRAQDTKYKTDPAKYKALALDAVNSFTLRPSVTVESGGGYQCYWLLDVPFLIRSDEDRTYIANLYRRWNDYTGGDPACKDLRRILRVPGTMNVKPKYAPNYPTAGFVWCELDRTYTLSQIEAALPAVEEAPTTEATHCQPAHRLPRAKTLRTHIDAGPTTRLGPFAVRVAMAYNAAHNIADELRNVGYIDAGHNRMSRPGDANSKGVQINADKNGSFHHSSNDPLFGEHLQKPFDVRRVYAFGGDAEAAANGLAREVGIMPADEMTEVIAAARRIVVSGDWSKIIPLERQSAAGYKTGDTDRKLFDNLLDIMQRAEKVTDVAVSYRQLISTKNADGVPVAIASVQTAKHFLDRLNNVLLIFTQTDRGTVVSLMCTMIATLDTSINTLFSEVSNLDTMGVYSGHKADDAFAHGCARWASEVTDAEKQRLMADNPNYADAAIAYKKALAAKPVDAAEMCQLIGADTLATYRELQVLAAADFLPGLGTYGLLVIVDLLDNPHSTRKEIAERRGLPITAVANVLRKLETWELVESDRADTFGAPKFYSLVGDVFGEIESKLPEAKTYKIGVQRLDRRLEQAQVWAEQAVVTAETEEMRLLAQKRVNRIAQQRFMTVPMLHPELTEDEVVKHIYTSAYHPARPQVVAPEMPEPGALSWYRLCELTGKELLTADELAELIALDQVLGAGVKFVPNSILEQHRYDQTNKQKLIDTTIRLVNTPVQAPLFTSAMA